MFKRASNWAVTGGEGRIHESAVRLNPPVQCRKKCKDLSVHIYADGGHPTLASLTVPSRRDGNTFQHQKYLLKIRRDIFHQPRIPKLLGEVAKLFLLTELLRCLVTSSAPLVRPGTRLTLTLDCCHVLVLNQKHDR